MYLSCDTKKFHDNESTHILRNFWTSTHRGGAFPLLPLAAPLVVVVVVSLIITLSTAKQHQFCRLKLYEVKHNISLNDDGQHVPCRFT